jgi:hypothetical protein
VLDRLHPGLHDALLQLAGDHAEPLGATDQRRVAGLHHAANQLVPGQHQLADHVHQGVEQVDVDPDGAVRDTALRRLGLQRLMHRGGLCLALLEQDRAELAFIALELLLQREPDVGRLRRAGLDQQLAQRAALAFDRLRCRPDRDLEQFLGRLRFRGRRHHGGLGRRLHLGVHRRDDRVHLDVTLGAALLNRGEQGPYAVDRREQRGDRLRRDRLHAVTQPGQQRLTRVRQRLQPGERQEPAGALDRVDRPEDA